MLNTEPQVPTARDPEREKKLQLASAYRSLVDSFAFKHLKDTVLERIKSQAIADEDAVDMKDLSMGVIGECRGRRNAVNKILREIENYLQPI